MKYIWNEKALKKLLEKDEKKITDKYSNELQIEINSLRVALNMPVIRNVTATNDNIISLLTISSANYIFRDRLKNVDYVYRKESLNSKEIITKARKTMESDEKRYFNKLIKQKKINLGNVNNQTFYLPYHNDNLISINNRGKLSDSRNIMHELAHAMYFKELNYSELENVNMSYFKEVLPIFNEMCFIDRLDKYDDISYEQKVFLTNYYVRYENKNYSDVYSQSFTLALYLFMLYKTDKSKFDYQYNLFKEKLKTITDDKIIVELNVDRTDLLSANDKYLRLYKK